LDIIPILIEKIYVLLLSKSTNETEKEILNDWFKKLILFGNERKLKISEFVVEEILEEYIY
jgi:hypothetical protein